MDKTLPEATITGIKRLSPTSILLSWQRPDGCHSVDISIRDAASAGPPPPLEDATDNKRFMGLVEGKTYIFSIKAKHVNHEFSRGFEFEYRHEHLIEPFPIQVNHIKDYTFRVSWQLPELDLPVRVLADGEPVGGGTANMKHTDIDLPPNTRFTISAEVFSQNNWVPSARTEAINTYLPVTINPEATIPLIKEKPGPNGYYADMQIKLHGPVPRGATGFYYGVRTNPSAKWVQPDEIGPKKSPGVYSLSMERYERNSFLPYDLTVQMEENFYITLYTEYTGPDGESVYARHCTQLPRPLNVDVYWAVKKPPGLFKAPYLDVEIRSNQLLRRRPRLVLCATTAPGKISSPSDHNAEILREIPPEDFAKPVQRYNQDFEITRPVGKNKNLFLFIQADKDPTRECKYISRLFEGFNGRL